MDKTSPLAALQRKRLTELQQLGICTDTSFVEHLRALGQPCSRASISKMRAGERICPLGLLELLLSHCDEAERIAVLSLWAAPFGLQVIPAELGPEERWRLRMVLGEIRGLKAKAEQLAVALEPIAEERPLRRVA